MKTSTNKKEIIDLVKKEGKELGYFPFREKYQDKYELTLINKYYIEYIPGARDEINDHFDKLEKLTEQRLMIEEKKRDKEIIDIFDKERSVLSINAILEKYKDKYSEGEMMFVYHRYLSSSDERGNISWNIALRSIFYLPYYLYRFCKTFFENKKEK